MEHVNSSDKDLNRHQQLEGSLVWAGDDVDIPSSVITLSTPEAAEIVRGLEKFKELGLDIRNVNAENFPLPNVGQLLQDIAVNIHDGTGFNIIRGLKPAHHSTEDFMTIYLGIASHVGSQRGVQNRRGEMISHITDAEHWTTPHDQRHGIHTTSALPFHCDVGAEVLALLCRETAQHGGDTSLVSSWTIHNEMAKQHPEDLAVLMRPDWPIQTSGTPLRYMTAPLMQYNDDKMITMVDPGRLGLHPATASGPRAGSDGMPELTTVQTRALETFSGLARQLAATVRIQAGDVLLVNNLALLHAREPYEDDALGARRHLVRLWLRSPEHSWSIPDCMRPLWEPAYGDSVGRLLPRRYPVVPEPQYKVPKYTSGSAAWAVDDSDEAGAGGCTHQA